MLTSLADISYSSIMASGKLAVEKRLFSHDEFSDYDDYGM